MAGKGKIWVDLENSPHVPFFVPIIDELRRRGYSVFVTARDCFQVRELADLFHLDYTLIGHHAGKSDLLKMVGLCLRGMKLIPFMRRERPNLAVSHGSRSQLITCICLGIPSIFMRDYEFSTPLPLFRPTWLMCPDVIPSDALQCDPRRVLKYPGIKEDVYISRFAPDPSIRARLGLQEQELVATLRPPASEAHYRDPRSEELFEVTVTFLCKSPDTKLVILPRNERQAFELKERWATEFTNGTIRIPAHAVDGLNLIWHSDLVISGGGTMNREAAGLGVPVYSVFRGQIGAVDRYLSRQGRLVLLETAEDVRSKITLKRRNRSERPNTGNNAALRAIVDRVTTIMSRERASQVVKKNAGLAALASTNDKRLGEFRGSEFTAK